MAKGFKRLFSLRAIIEFVKGLLKISIITVVLIAVLLPDFDDLGKLVIFDITATLAVLRDESLKLLAAVLFVLAIIAIADFVYQRWEHARNLRMTKQEVKDEFKQTEGDPQIKGKIRQLRSERARKRMMAAVPQADAVITNPTHYAVALSYNQETMQAPIVTAKGSDHLALRIRQIAEENDVPVVENPPLAQALYHGVDIDQEVPQQHYRAVAEVISYVFSLRGRRQDANRQGQR